MRARVRTMASKAAAVLGVAAALLAIAGALFAFDNAQGEYVDATIASINYDSRTCKVRWAGSGTVEVGVPCPADSIDRGETIRIFLVDGVEPQAYTDRAEVWDTAVALLRLAAVAGLLALVCAWIAGRLTLESSTEPPDA